MDLCSLLLHAHPDRLAAVEDALRQWQGVEVHATEPDGRMVVTVEGDDPGRFGETVLALRDIDGVIDASLVYHYHDGSFEAEEIVRRQRQVIKTLHPAYVVDAFIEDGHAGTIEGCAAPPIPS